jgi:demethylmenaquinone methyltransferase/2-methoxy-6-polyprenyl-1,4-benzoquinol methylase
MNHFDLLASIYDRLISPPEESRLIELVELPDSGLILDAGGGTGRIAQKLTGESRTIILQDYSHKMLLQSKNKDGMQAVASETEDLPFPAECFDRIIMVDAYHHLRDQRKCLDELWRVLREGGILVIEEPDIRHFGIKLVALAEKLTLMRSHFHSPSVISEGLNSIGAQCNVVCEGYNAWIIARKSD